MLSVDGEGGVKGDTWMGDRHVPIELENAPKSAQNMAKKYSDSARIFEKVLEIFKNSARNLLVVLNYFLADVQKIFLVLSRL